jgi:hypothetical protein
MTLVLASTRNQHFVIPGRRVAASPESITTILSMDSGLAPKRARPGMTTG